MASKSVGFDSTKSKSLKICGCKRWCPQYLRVCAPDGPVLTHSLNVRVVYVRSDLHIRICILQIISWSCKYILKKLAVTYLADEFHWNFIRCGFRRTIAILKSQFICTNSYPFLKYLGLPWSCMHSDLEMFLILFTFSTVYFFGNQVCAYIQFVTW